MLQRPDGFTWFLRFSHIELTTCGILSRVSFLRNVHSTYYSSAVVSTKMKNTFVLHERQICMCETQRTYEQLVYLNRRCMYVWWSIVSDDASCDGLPITCCAIISQQRYGTTYFAPFPAFRAIGTGWFTNVAYKRVTGFTTHPALFVFVDTTWKYIFIPMNHLLTNTKYTLAWFILCVYLLSWALLPSKQSAQQYTSIINSWSGTTKYMVKQIP